MRTRQRLWAAPRRSKDRSARSCAPPQHHCVCARGNTRWMRHGCAAASHLLLSAFARAAIAQHVLRWACAPARAVPHQSKSRSAAPFVKPHVCPNLFEDAQCACVFEGVCEGVQMARCERGLPRHECTRVHSSFGCGPLRRSPALLAAMRHAPRQSQRMRCASRLRRKHRRGTPLHGDRNERPRHRMCDTEKCMRKVWARACMRACGLCGARGARGFGRVGVPACVHARACAYVRGCV